MKLGRYRHYKGRDYEVIGVALDVVTEKKVVLYKALYKCPDLEAEYGADPVFTRPYAMFFEQIEHEGKTLPRFQWSGK